MSSRIWFSPILHLLTGIGFVEGERVMHCVFGGV